MSYSDIHARLMQIRAEALALGGDELAAMHGSMVGVMCVVERIRGRKEFGDDRSLRIFSATDRLIKELRASDGPL